MIVTKEQILDAIMTEPLKPGSWFSVYSGTADPQLCPVCAVGAVLRKACNVIPFDNGHYTTPSGDIRHVMDDVINWDYPCTYVNTEGFLPDTPWMNKLSAVFEDMCYEVEDEPDQKLAMEAVRLELCDYVREEFPENIEVNV